LRTDGRREYNDDKGDPWQMPTKRDAKREQIREAAFRSFRERGYHDTSVDRICAEAGISKGSLYWHYDSKQAIFIDLIESWARRIMEEVFRRFEEAALHQTDFAPFVKGALLDEARRGNTMVPLWLELSAIARHDDAIRTALAKVYRRARAAISEVMRPITPDLDERQRRGLAAAIFGTFTGLVMQGMVDPEAGSAEELLTAFMEVVEKWLTDTGALDLSD
jgi:AcrR family transcriptional regulator